MQDVCLRLAKLSSDRAQLAARGSAQITRDALRSGRLHYCGLFSWGPAHACRPLLTEANHGRLQSVALGWGPTPDRRQIFICVQRRGAKPYKDLCTDGERVCDVSST